MQDMFYARSEIKPLFGRPGSYAYHQQIKTAAFSQCENSILRTISCSNPRINFHIEVLGQLLNIADYLKVFVAQTP